MESGQVLHSSPYVEQIDKFAASLKQLSKTSLQLEEKKQTFSEEEIERMFDRVRERVCEKCEKNSWCWGENYIHMYQMGYEILAAVDQYGNELNTETQRKLAQRCILASDFQSEMLEGFREARQNMIWVNRIARSREGCAIQLNTFADMLQSTAKNLEDRMFTDERLEKKLISRLKKKGIRVLSVHFFVNEERKYELHLIMRTWKEEKIQVKELSRLISELTRRRMIPGNDSVRLIGSGYVRVVFREGTAYHTISGVARIGKGCSSISGDSFTMMDLPGGKRGVALSDGMGCGPIACRESTLVIELLEELLEAGFPEKTAIQMINTTLVMGREEIHYSTIDLVVFDLYTGECELIKAGASSTFIRVADKVEHLTSTSLPIGVMNSIEIDSVKRQLEDDSYVIMITDGVLDALPVGEQEFLLETIIRGTKIQNPRELARHILQQVLNWTGKEPEDDMSVLVVGIWKTNALT